MLLSTIQSIHDLLGSAQSITANRHDTQMPCYGRDAKSDTPCNRLHLYDFQFRIAYDNQAVSLYLTANIIDHRRNYLPNT